MSEAIPVYKASSLFSVIIPNSLSPRSSEVPLHLVVTMAIPSIKASVIAVLYPSLREEHTKISDSAIILYGFSIYPGRDITSDSLFSRIYCSNERRSSPSPNIVRWILCPSACKRFIIGRSRSYPFWWTGRPKDISRMGLLWRLAWFAALCCLIAWSSMGLYIVMTLLSEGNLSFRLSFVSFESHAIVENLL